MPDRSPTPWLQISGRAALVSLAAVAGSYFMRLDAIGLLAVLFSVGFLAGAWGRRQGWLSGIIAGFPMAFRYVSHWAAGELGRGVYASADYWRIAVPAAMVAGGMAVLGSMTGAWLQDMKLQREN